MTKKNKNLNEGLEYGDLAALVSDIVSIDQYQPKLSEEIDAVVLAFMVKYEEPSAALSNFIETSGLELLDVEVSDTPNADGHYIVFIEFTRERDLFDKISAVLDIVDRVTTQDEHWQYVAFNQPVSQAFNLENFSRDIVTSALDYKKKFINKNIEESMIRDLRKMAHRY